MKKPEVLSRNPIYQSSWVNLYVDKVRFPNGAVIEQHHLLDFEQPAVMVIASDANHGLLMVKVCRYPTGRTEWEFPAGRIEKGEEIVQAAKRELLEETGYHSNEPEIIYTFNPLNGIANQVFYVTRCQVIGARGEFDTGEITELRWFTEPEIWQMIQSREIKDGYSLTSFLLHKHL